MIKKILFLGAVGFITLSADVGVNSDKLLRVSIKLIKEVDILKSEVKRSNREVIRLSNRVRLLEQELSMAKNTHIVNKREPSCTGSSCFVKLDDIAPKSRVSRSRVKHKNNRYTPISKYALYLGSFRNISAAKRAKKTLSHRSKLFNSIYISKERGKYNLKTNFTGDKQALNFHFNSIRRFVPDVFYRKSKVQ